MIEITLDALLKERGMGMTELSDKTGIPLPSLAALRDDRAAAVRLTSIDAICRVLDCRPGDLMTYYKEKDAIDHADV
ncbi:MAG: helix-turn-helix domain-containing protein [Acutalibacteraceae bacterium]|jgi:putative transcriptional regulator